MYRCITYDNKIILLPLVVVARIACDKTCVLPSPLVCLPLRHSFGCPLAHSLLFLTGYGALRRLLMRCMTSVLLVVVYHLIVTVPTPSEIGVICAKPLSVQ